MPQGEEVLAPERRRRKRKAPSEGTSTESLLGIGDAPYDGFSDRHERWGTGATSPR